MSARRSKRFERTGLALFVISALSVAACSGDSSAGDDDDASGGSGGGSPFGGAAGTSGASGASGASGSGSDRCVEACERVELCSPAGTAVDCTEECRILRDNATRAICDPAFSAYVDCLYASSDACNPVECVTESDAYLACLDGNSCRPGSVPVNTSCSSLCARLSACGLANPECETWCLIDDAEAAAQGCSTSYRTYLGCLSSCGDICVVSEYDCTQAEQAYLVCAADYCAANPDAMSCL